MSLCLMGSLAVLDTVGTNEGALGNDGKETTVDAKVSKRKKTNGSAV